jgi:hypothetical protein
MWGQQQLGSLAAEQLTTVCASHRSAPPPPPHSPPLAKLQDGKLALSGERATVSAGDRALLEDALRGAMQRLAAEAAAAAASPMQFVSGVYVWGRGAAGVLALPLQTRPSCSSAGLPGSGPWPGYVQGSAQD